MKKIILTTIILAGFSAQASPGECNSGKGCKKISTCTEIIGACEVNWGSKWDWSRFYIYEGYRWKFKARVHSIYQCFGDVDSKLRNLHLRGDYKDTEHKDNLWWNREFALSKCKEQKRMLIEANGCPEFLFKL